MIRTMMVHIGGKVEINVPIEKIFQEKSEWYWVDFQEPTSEEIEYLSTLFQFHHLAIEDCLNMLQRPKLDDYGDYQFIVLHALVNSRLRPEEVNVFRGEHYLVSFHMKPNRVIHEIWKRVGDQTEILQKGTDYLLYMILDGLVDQYFPVLYKIDDELERLESEYFLRPNQRLINRIFKTRKDLHSIRRSIEPSQDVVRQILHPQHDKWKTHHRLFYADIYDHLTKLLEMTDTFLQIGIDLINSYTSLSSQRMNRIMMVLTVITTIFMPLTLIVGIYGMNFDNMPELHWKYGYYIVLAVMAGIAGTMVLWFRRKGWF